MTRLLNSVLAFAFGCSVATAASATETLPALAALQNPAPPPTSPAPFGASQVVTARDVEPSGGSASPSSLIELDPTRRWSVLVEGFGGLGVLKSKDGTEAHSFGGGMGRFRIWYLQAGGYAELTDRENYDTRAFGGVIGAYFPFRTRHLGPKGLLGKWVDLDAVLGFGVRTYTSNDVRYGAGGFEASTPVGSLRLGVSDRSGSGTLAARFGAHLLASVDFAPKTKSWQVSYDSEGEAGDSFSGRTHIGGYSFGMALSLGFDIGRAY
jgi:hypothetical protein